MFGIYHEAQRESPKIICEVEEEFGEKYGKENQGLRLDNGGEYKSDPFLKLCLDEGIERHLTVRKHRNRTAERMNMTLLEKVRCMLSNASLAKNFWAETLTYACYLVNRLPSSVIGGKTPLEVWLEKLLLIMIC